MPKWENVGGAEEMKEGAWEMLTEGAEDKQEGSAHRRRARRVLRERSGMMCAMKRNTKQCRGPEGDRVLGTVPILASLSCHQVFNIAVTYNLWHRTFLIFWSILLARFPEVGLLSQNVGAF